MTEEKKKTFSVKKRENAPEFVLGSFGCKVNDLIPYMNSKGYVNFDILKGKEEGMYVKINDYGLNKSDDVVTIGDIKDEEIPF